jgi:hypothetical protein
MKIEADDIERIIDRTLSRTGLASLLIWVVALAIWWQALA